MGESTQTPVLGADQQRACTLGLFSAPYEHEVARFADDWLVDTVVMEVVP